MHHLNLAFCLAHLAGIRHHLQPHASAIARLGGGLGLSDEQIDAMTAAAVSLERVCQRSSLVSAAIRRLRLQS
ncbi:hypothetical protein CN184_30090 [Sinorhizobium medicae]|nr:hypothetical protein CN184_30090 [Sinorhizobium medicae]